MHAACLRQSHPPGFVHSAIIDRFHVAIINSGIERHCIVKNGNATNTDCRLVNLKIQFLIIDLPEEET
jgi:hypothetical protein